MHARLSRSIALFLVVATTGCAASQVRSAGAVCAGAGLAMVAAGTATAVGCPSSSEELAKEGGVCVVDSEQQTEAGLIGVVVGMSVTVVGFAIWAAGEPTKTSKPSTPPPLSNGNLY
jgi:hypothetical protein